MKAQFRAANRLGAAAAAVVGSEWDGGLVTVRALDTGEELQMAVEEVAEWTKRR